jgi:maltooligosyltrehalose trehalohydrolase
VTDAASALFRRAWQPTLGARPDGRGCRFSVWAPGHRRIEIIVRSGEQERRTLLEAGAAGVWSVAIDDVAPGARYGYLLDGSGPFPDPASRWQPDGVHGLSAVVDPRTYRWSDEGWRGVPLEQAIFYELHVGTFTPQGTFAGVTERLPYLADLGVTVLELMPVADFPGTRNWGYDGVSLFAPARCYGTPDDLRRLVDEAHRHGLAVLLDVVYNHFGPDGAYAATFSPFYVSTRHTSPWGAAVNFDGDQSEGVRTFVVENALHWLHEYHVDGLRVDATHAIVDDSPQHIVAELAARARASVPRRTLLIVAEDDRNLATIVRPASAGGWGLDAVWADDFHHQAQRISAGDRDGYYEDFSDDVRDLATTIGRGWFHIGQWSAYRDGPHGTDPSGVPASRMIVCLQNHDQVGNRAFGERLHQQADPAVFRALSAVLLSVPETPLLFMGQEWAASTPFLFFTDHETDLGKQVTEGRRREFARFAAFRDEAGRARIPDPQALATLEASRLKWTEQHDADHAGTLAFYRELLRLRRSDPALAASAGTEVGASDARTIVLKRHADAGGALLLVADVAGGSVVDLGPWIGHPAADAWSVVLTSEDQRFLGPSERHVAAPPAITLGPGWAGIRFARPSAVILRAP